MSVVRNKQRTRAFERDPWVPGAAEMLDVQCNYSFSHCDIRRTGVRQGRVSGDEAIFCGLDHYVTSIYGKFAL
jgi:hypothetical protein